MSRRRVMFTLEAVPGRREGVMVYLRLSDHPDMACGPVAIGDVGLLLDPLFEPGSDDTPPHGAVGLSLI